MSARFSVPQRLVLIFGAVAVLVVLVATPRVSFVRGTYFRAFRNGQFADMLDVRTTLTLTIAVVVATLLLTAAIGRGRQDAELSERLDDLQHRFTRLEERVTDVESHITEP